MRRRKLLAVILTLAALSTSIIGCGNDNVESKKITVISREEGSGTRGAFVEIIGIEKKDESGEKVDRTTARAETTSSTAVMITTVQSNDSAIGYISLGSLDTKKVKALKVDNVEATVENIKSGKYTVSRPFNIVTPKEVNDEAKDFIKFILSKEGQKIVENQGYIAVDTDTSYEKSDISGKIVVGGSSSVSPVMEKLIEGYKEINTNMNIELQTNDSSTGVSATAEGSLDIGMASRALKDSEKQKGLEETEIAVDGIAVIINKDNEVEGLTKEQIMKIYIGDVTKWSELD